MAAATTDNILAKTYIIYSAQSVQTLLFPTAIKVLETVDSTLKNLIGYTPYNKIKFGDFLSTTNSFITSINNIFAGAKSFIAGQITTENFINLTISNLGLDNIISSYVGFVEDVVAALNQGLNGVKQVPPTFNQTDVNTGQTVTLTTIDNPDPVIIDNATNVNDGTSIYNRYEIQYRNFSYPER